MSFAARAGLILLAAVVLAPAAARAQDDAFHGCRAPTTTFDRTVREPVADRPGVYRTRLIGLVRIECDGTRVFADEVDWIDDEDVVYARGNVLLDQEGLRIAADRAEIDRRTQLGVFHQVTGTIRLGHQRVERSLFGTLEPDAYFSGDRLERTGPRTYKLTNGRFTTCVQAAPRWEVTSGDITIVLDKRAIIRNPVLRVKDVPIVYLPLMYYPMGEDDRSTGFLLPTYGSSSIRGFTLSNAFFWAINRSQDATVYHDWFARSGQGVGGEYRYAAAPGSNGTARVYLIDERDQTAGAGTGIERSARRSWEIRGHVNQGLPRGFRVFGRADYFNDVTTRQLYDQNIYDFSRRSRYVGATLTGGVGRYRMSASFEQSDFYYGVLSATRRGRAPSVNLSMGEKPIGRSRVYFGAGGEAGRYVRIDDLSRPETDNGLWRVDAAPTVRVPLSTLPFLSVTTAASWRITYWSERRDPETGAQIPEPLTRRLLDLRARAVGPVLAKVWQTPDSGYAERFKHVIEPSVTVQWLSKFDEFDHVAQAVSDATDFVYPGITRVSYALTNRLLARRKVDGAPGQVREILSVDVSQSYYTDARASQYDQQYQSSYGNIYGPAGRPSPFSAIQVTAQARPTDAVNGQFRMEYDWQFGAVRTYAASGAVGAPAAHITAGWSKRQFIPGLRGFDNPDFADHFLNASVNVRRPDNRVGGTYAFNLDARRGVWLQQRIVAYYNAQCCGIAVDYQTIGLGHIGGVAQPTDRRVGVSFTLAGIGSFSNPLGAFGDNSGRR